MTPEKKNELVTHLLVSNLAEVEALRDMVFGYIHHQLDSSQEAKEIAAKKYQEGVSDRRQAILAQIELYYKDRFGGIDDLLDSLGINA